MQPAVHHLLDGEKRNHGAADRDGDVKRCNWGHRRHSQTFEAIEKIQEAEVNHAERDAQHDRAVEQFEEQAAVSGHRFSEHREIEMVVAAGRPGDPPE